jgi:hypothetical protein
VPVNAPKKSEAKIFKVRYLQRDQLPDHQR